jgi:hypothetical protein
MGEKPGNDSLIGVIYFEELIHEFRDRRVQLLMDTGS